MEFLFLYPYDVLICIFISVDPLAEQTFEPYSYTGNNPIMFTDPTGMSKVGPPDPPGFWGSFFSSVARGVGAVVNHVVNNPNHAGYGYHHNMKKPSVSDFSAYQINWGQQLDPTWQAKNFSTNAIMGTVGFIGGIMNQDGASVAQSIPKLVSTFATISVLRSFKLSQGKQNFTLNILEGKYSSSEINAANYMWKQGNNVTLRPPNGSKNSTGTGATSDLVVNGMNYDVYTPTTSNVNSIISAIAKKNKQTQGIILDLSKSSADPSQFNNALQRVQGAGARNIKDIQIIKEY